MPTRTLNDTRKSIQSKVLSRVESLGLVKILEISMSHNASVAVSTEDVRVIEALAEERLSRVKNHWGFLRMAYEIVPRKHEIKKVVIR